MSTTGPTTSRHHWESPSKIVTLTQKVGAFHISNSCRFSLSSHIVAYKFSYFILFRYFWSTQIFAFVANVKLCRYGLV
ncbi:unnamed protein product [Acanthoscelides obtectus]|uniref:Uncharacterized protein n=1 Tax=Acanthoscelides obtectus TaxID=200917 RepID=A0A9P0M4B2_ACAOB|nr:unnamed protein product [Acanthoscelides obtectus]CAK1688865.1 hypothetical protein AOBTE_LOCUS36932 [Acanthoscelides obtectus]